MTRILPLILSVMLFVFPTYTQWIWQNPLPQGKSLNDIHVFDQTRIIAVGEHGTILMTNDAGLNWDIKHYTGGTTGTLYSISFADLNNGWTVGSEGSVLRTTDGGAIWTQQSSGINSDLISVFFIDSNVGWAGGNSGVIKTTDSGISWTSPSGFGRVNSIHFSDVNIGYAVGANGLIQHTTNGGTNWTQQVSGTSFDLHAVHFINPNYGWICGSDGIIIKTTNGGTNWVYQATGTVYPLLSICFSDMNNGWAVGDLGIVLKTSDGGNAWNKQETWVIYYPNGWIDSDGFFDLRSVNFPDLNNGWAVGANGIIIRTTDGGQNWIRITRGTGHLLDAIQFLDHDHAWIAGYIDNILSTTNGGNTWDRNRCGTRFSLLKDVYFLDRNIGWVAGDNGVFMTTDGGINWVWKTPVPPFDYNYHQSIYFANPDTGLIVGFYGYNFVTYNLLSTTNAGATWAHTLLGGGGGLYSVHFANRSTGWIVGDAGTIHKTSDGGQHWFQQASGTSTPLYAVQFVDENVGWVVGPGPSLSGNGIILKTTNGGISWARLNYGSTIKLRELFFLDSNYGWVVGENGTFFRTTDGGLNWTSHSVIIDDLSDIFFLDANVGWVLGRGLLKTTDGGVTFIPPNQSKANPDNFVLYQNHPNPFNPDTRIEYSIPKAGYVELQISNLLGQKIRTLISAMQTSGTKSIIWDGTDTHGKNVASGIYFYTLRFEGRSQTKKMLLIQ